MNEIVLLITGCIAPDSSQKYLELKDIDERLKQYIDSIMFYIQESNFQKIVFCENSNTKFDISEICKAAKIKNKIFEFISFQGNANETVLHGKGYGEGEIIDYALNHSELLTNSLRFAKVTGRLIIRNIDAITNQLDRSDNANYFFADIYRIKAIDTRFFVSTKIFYNNHLRSTYKQTDNSSRKAIEDLFYEQLKNEREYRCFKKYPRFDGKSGGNGRNYSKENNLKLRFFDILCLCGIFNRVYFLYSNSIFRRFVWHFWGEVKR